MKRVMVRYRVKRDRASENEAFVQDVFAELARRAPDGLRYTSLKLEDGVSFVHIMEAEEGDALTELAAFKSFTARIRERCDEAPVATAFEPVGSYRMSGPG